jgi:hypothetical protein
MSTTGGSTWSVIDDSMDDGYSIGILPGTVYQGGCWDVTDDINNQNSVPAVFKSSDNGTNWQRMQLSTAVGDIRVVVVNPANKNMVYAGGSTKDASKLDVPVLFKSTNGGSNWTPAAFSATGSTVINAILLDPSNANRIYLGTNQGIYYTTNGGTNWQAPSTWMSTVCLNADPKTANKVYAGTGSGVYVTTNGGSAWTPMNSGLLSTNVQCLEVDPVHNVLYAGTYGGGTFRTSIASGVEDQPETRIPEQAVLYQNYPNPFNASTVIQFRMNQKANVRLSVFDMNGRLVRMLWDGIQSAGMKQAVWNAKDGSGNNVPSGMYFCRLETGQGIAIRKMIVEK